VLDRVGPCYLCKAIPPKKNKRLPGDWIATGDEQEVKIVNPEAFEEGEG